MSPRVFTAKQLGINPDTLIPGKPKRRSPTRKPINLKAAKIKADNDRRAAEFKVLLRQAGLPQPVREHYFAAAIGRRWRFDFAWEDEKVALEQDGGIFVAGRHARGAGILEQHEKLNAAAGMGWRILYATPKGLCTDPTVTSVREALEYKP